VLRISDSVRKQLRRFAASQTDQKSRAESVRFDVGAVSVSMRQVLSHWPAEEYDAAYDRIYAETFGFDVPTY
jgi:hypothetical protein